MDNSAYELGEDYDIEKFAYSVSTYNPSYYILPDVIGDIKKTIEKIDHFVIHTLEKYDIRSKPMGVIQGNTIDEFIESHKYYEDLGVDYIAIPHAIPMLRDLVGYNGSNMSSEEAQGRGRLKLIEILENKGIIKNNINYHILGVLLPQETIPLKTKTYIKSIDTSNPVLNGMLGIRYQNGTLDSKPTEKMHDLMENKINIHQESIILHNIKEFKENLD
jgi:hypothetical protein